LVPHFPEENEGNQSDFVGNGFLTLKVELRHLTSDTQQQCFLSLNCLIIYRRRRFRLAGFLQESLQNYPENPVNPVQKKKNKIESIPSFLSKVSKNQFVRYPACRPMPVAKIHQRWNFLRTSIKSMRTTVLEMAAEWVVVG
jgi:hypothetical protein